MLSLTLKKLIKKENLSDQECAQALEAMLSLKHPEQVAAFLSLMRAKGETSDEIAAFVRGLQTYQIKVNIDIPLLDIVGTGGDGANTANISTGASILAASCGVPILKHGNRAVSSQAGAADVLESLGFELNQSPEAISESVRNNHFGFCYAPLFHPALLSLKPLRSALKIPTLFNILGPLLNPAQAPYILLGVFDPTLLPLVAEVLIKLGIKRGMVVHGSGLDELNCLGPCEVIEINGATQTRKILDPQSLGLPLCHLDDLVGGDAHHNARLIQQVISNQPSHLANTMILNAAAAVTLYGKSSTLEEGIDLVRENIANGYAERTLAQCLECSGGRSHG